MTLYHFKHFCNLLPPRLKRPLKSLRKSSSPCKLQLHVQAVTQVSRLCYTYLGYNPPSSGYSHICYPRSDGFYWLETLRSWSPGPQGSANTKDTSQISPPRMLLPVFPHFILLPYFSFQLLQHLLYPNLRRNFKIGVCHFFSSKFLIFVLLYTVLTFCIYHYVLSFGIKFLNYRRDCYIFSFFVLSFMSQISDFLLKSHLFKPTNQQQATFPNTTSTIAPLQSGLSSKKWILPLPLHSLQRNLSFKLWFVARCCSQNIHRCRPHLLLPIPSLFLQTQQPHSRVPETQCLTVTALNTNS